MLPRVGLLPYALRGKRLKQSNKRVRQRGGRLNLCAPFSSRRQRSFKPSGPLGCIAGRTRVYTYCHNGPVSYLAQIRKLQKKLCAPSRRRRRGGGLRARLAVTRTARKTH